MHADGEIHFCIEMRESSRKLFFPNNDLMTQIFTLVRESHFGSVKWSVKYLRRFTPSPKVSDFLRA
jgi:hypothetical protein